MPKPKFKPGDKVIHKNGTKDTVELVPGMYDYDESDYSAADKGFVLEKSMWEYQKDWRLFKDPADKLFDKLKSELE